MRPRLRNDVFFVPTDNGAFCLDGDSRHHLTGRSLYRWIERLTPYLDGQHTVAELTAELPVERRAAVERLVGELHRLNLVRDLSAQAPHSLTSRELQTYAPEIAYLEDFLDDAHSRFQRYRDTPVLAVGSGTALLALVRAIVQSGIRDVLVDGLDDASVRELLAGRAELDPHQRIHGAAKAVDQATLVLHMADLSTPDPAVLDEQVAAAGGRLVQAVFTGDEAFVGPFATAERPESSWRAAWARLARPVTKPTTRFRTPPTEAIVANQVVFTAFKHLTGVTAREDPPTVSRLDLVTLETTSHRVVPHPLALPLSEPAEARPDIDEDEFSRRATELVDAEFGVVRAVEELHFAQFPLRLARAEVAGAVAFGAALDSGRARSVAVQRGLELYCAQLVDPRRVADGRVRGFNAVDGSEVLVPAKDVHPDVPFRELPVGVASGPTWTDAVQAGLLAQCRWLAMAGLAGDGVFTRVEDVELDETGARYRELVRLLGKQIDIYDIGVVPGAEVFAFCVDGRCVAYQAGLTAAAAVRDGYEALLLDHQSTANRQFAYAPPAVPALRPERMGAALRTRHEGVVSLAESLAANGHRPVVVPLDHDPAVRAVLPNVVRVVLVDGAR
jgi:hypothetical protein